MEKFEIHITGTPNIISILEEIDVKSLHALLKDPNGKTLGHEYMSSFIKEFNNYEECYRWVLGFSKYLESRDVVIYRTKIECPYFYSHYRGQSIYIEAHFPFKDNKYPFVENKKSGKLVSTERVYLDSEYDQFIKKWDNYSGAEIEFCLFDDNVRLDNYWIKTFETVKDEFLVEGKSFNRLLNEYQKYGSLVIGVDFDGTLYDYHQTGATYNQVKNLIRDLKSINCKIICWTAQKDHQLVENYLLSNNIPFDGINVDGIDLGWETRKPFFSALLDDRAGLIQVYEDLRSLVDLVSNSKFRDEEVS